MLPYSISLLEGKKYVCLTPPCNFLNYTKQDIGPCNILSSIFVSPYVCEFVFWCVLYVFIPYSKAL